MVDMNTYKVMHDSTPSLPGREELEDIAMHNETPPEDPFSLILPATIKGFGFHNKKWSEHPRHGIYPEANASQMSCLWST